MCRCEICGQQYWYCDDDPDCNSPDNTGGLCTSCKEKEAETAEYEEYEARMRKKDASKF